MWSLLIRNSLTTTTKFISCEIVSSQFMGGFLMWHHLNSTHANSSHVKSSHPNSCETFSCEIFSCEIISYQLMWNLLMWNHLMWRRITLTHVNCLVSKPTHSNLHKNYKVWTGANTVTQCKDSDEFRPNISHRQSVGLHVKIPSETLRESIPWHDFCWDREQQNTIPSILKPPRLYPVL